MDKLRRKVSNGPTAAELLEATKKFYVKTEALKERKLDPNGPRMFKTDSEEELEMLHQQGDTYHRFPCPMPPNVVSVSPPATQENASEGVTFCLTSSPLLRSNPLNTSETSAFEPVRRAKTPPRPPKSEKIRQKLHQKDTVLCDSAPPLYPRVRRILQEIPVVVVADRAPANGLRVTQLGHADSPHRAALRRACSAVGYNSAPRRNTQVLRHPQPPPKRRQTTEIFAAQAIPADQASKENFWRPAAMAKKGKNGAVECGVDVDFRRNDASLAADLLRVAVPTDASNALSRTYYPMKTGPLVDCTSEQGTPFVNRKSLPPLPPRHIPDVMSSSWHPAMGTALLPPDSLPPRSPATPSQRIQRSASLARPNQLLVSTAPARRFEVSRIKTPERNGEESATSRSASSSNSTHFSAEKIHEPASPPETDRGISSLNTSEAATSPASSSPCRSTSARSDSALEMSSPDASKELASPDVPKDSAVGSARSSPKEELVIKPVDKDFEERIRRWDNKSRARRVGAPPKLSMFRSTQSAQSATASGPSQKSDARQQTADSIGDASLDNGFFDSSGLDADTLAQERQKSAEVVSMLSSCSSALTSISVERQRAASTLHEAPKKPERIAEVDVTSVFTDAASTHGEIAVVTKPVSVIEKNARVIQWIHGCGLASTAC